MAGAALVLDTVSGHDALDSTCLDRPPTDVAASLAAAAASAGGSSRLSGLRVGLPDELSVSELGEEQRSLWADGIAWLHEAGATVERVSLPALKDALAAYYVVASAEASSNLARYDGARYGAVRESGAPLPWPSRGDFGAEVRRRILAGTFVLSSRAYQSHYGRAQRVRRRLVDQLDGCMGEGGVDMLLTPAAMGAAPLLSDALSGAVTDAYVNDIMAVGPSLAGLPAITVPCALSSADRMPLALQLVGSWGGEAELCRVAQVLEDSAEFSSNTIVD